MTSENAQLSERDGMTFHATLGAVAAIIDRLPVDKKDRSPDDEFALIAIVKAYYKTKSCFDKLKVTETVPRSERQEIFKAWETAGMMFGKFDSTLPSRLGAKAGYWNDPVTWSQGNADQVQAGLELIDRALKPRN